MGGYEDELICDLCEYYGIKDYTSEPPFFIARLTLGLPITSRVQTKMSGLSVPIDMLIQSMICDRLGLLWWSKTADASRGKNRPEMLSEVLTSAKAKEKDSDYEKFETGEAFMDAWNRLSRKGV